MNCLPYFLWKKQQTKHPNKTKFKVSSDVILIALYMGKSRVERDCSNSNIFLKPLFRGNFDPFVNNANLGAIAHISNGT